MASAGDEVRDRHQGIVLELTVQAIIALGISA